MRNSRILLVTVLLALPAFLVLAQVNRVDTFERGFRPHVSQGKIVSGSHMLTRSPEPRVFHINGLEYRATIRGDSIQSGPDWTASQPVPVGFDRLETVARAELAKLVADDASWSVTSFQLHSIPEGLSLKWYFLVEMKPFWEAGPSGAGVHDSFCLCIDLSGKPGPISHQVH